MMGITTGEMPSVDLIWEIQQDENHHTCFGQGHGCPKRDCRWRRHCLALDSFADVPLPSARRVEKTEDKENRKTKSVEITSAPKEPEGV